MAKVGTASFIGALSGQTGNAVFVRRADGSVVLRQRVTPRDPETPAQQANRQRMRLAAAVFRSLTPAEQAAWAEAARRERDRRRREGLDGGPSAQNLFTGLAVRYLHLHGGEEAPRTPPALAFTGDGLAIAAEAVPGGVRFTAPGPNAAGVSTELLLQPLRTSASSRVLRAYRHGAYRAFGPGGGTVDLPAPPGWAAPAVRFVESATGQASALVELPALLVVAG